MPSLNLGPDLAALKATAIIQIDTAAEVARLKYITPGSGQALEYQATEAEGRVFLADPTLSLDSLPFLKAEVMAIATATGAMPNAIDVATSVVASSEAWKSIGSAIKELRRGAKMAVDAATTVTAIRAAQQISWP